MGISFRIGMKDRAILSLTKGRYWRALGMSFLYSSVPIFLLILLIQWIDFLVRTLPGILPLLLTLPLRITAPFSDLFALVRATGTSLPMASTGAFILLGIQLCAAVLILLPIAAGILLVMHPLSVGICGWFDDNRKGRTSRWDVLFRSFHRDRFSRIIGANLLRMKPFLHWLLLPILTALLAMVLLSIQYATDFSWWNADFGLDADSFVGIALPVLMVTIAVSITFLPLWIRSYDYRPLPWILATHPELTAGEAVGLSVRMTKGHRMDLLRLDFSFFGWILLSLATCGLGFLFLLPFYKAFQAQIFSRLSREENRGLLKVDIDSEEEQRAIRRPGSIQTDPESDHTGFR